MSPTEQDDPAAQEAAVLAHLREAGIPHEIVRIDPAYGDTAAFCAQYGYRLDESANCIVVAAKSRPAAHVACLVLADTRLDVNGVVRRLMGVRKASFASPEDTAARTGMAIGGVTPFGLPADMPLHVDAAVAARERIIVGGGSRALKLLVPPSAVLELPNARVVEGLARKA